MNKLVYTFALFCIGTGSLFSTQFTQEPFFNAPYPEEQTSFFESMKTFPFLGAGIYSTGGDRVVLPSTGISVRKGSLAIDLDLHSLIVLNKLSVCASKIWYRNPTHQGAYCSLGGGAFLIVAPIFNENAIGVCSPFRVGFQSDRAFFDAGIVMHTFSFYRHSNSLLRSAEIRGGFSF